MHKTLLFLLTMSTAAPLTGQATLKDRLDFGIGFGQVYVTDKPDPIEASSSWLGSIWGEYLLPIRGKFSAGIGLDYRQEWIITNGLFVDDVWSLPAINGASTHLRHRQLGLPLSTYLRFGRADTDQRFGIGYRPNYVVRSVFLYTDLDDNKEYSVDLGDDANRLHHELLISFLIRQTECNSTFPLRSFKMLGSFGLDRWQSNGYRPFTLQLQIGLL
jgi:hypothetical protein